MLYKLRQIIFVSVILCSLMTVGCYNAQKEITNKEMVAANEILQQNITADDLQNMTGEVITKERKEKFPAVKKVYRTTSNQYIFVSEPVAYNGPVVLVIVIDAITDETTGMRIVKHDETPHYVRDMESPWFTDRFNSKTVDTYLEVSMLEQKKDSDIIIITGATVTTQGIVNGVNAAIGAYREYALNEESESVELMVKGFVGAAK